MADSRCRGVDSTMTTRGETANMPAKRDHRGRFLPNLNEERFVVGKWNSGRTKAEIAAMLGKDERHVRRVLAEATNSGRYHRVLNRRDWRAFHGH